MCVVIPVFVSLYYTNDTFYKNIRFGFEGFFSLWETGKWQTSSNDILLEHMIVFPDNWRTWLIGDGYAANPLDPAFLILIILVLYIMDIIWVRISDIYVIFFILA